MNRLHRLTAASVFTYALVLYASTMARTASFWDAGEFIASAYGLQVMHPPGAPVYMLLGRLFAMFVPAAHVALAVNLVSVLASAVTVLLAYLIIARLIRHWRRGEEGPDWAAVVGGVVGACTFAATDSFWFNAVEAEVYGLSMALTALAVWLGLVWSAKARAGASGSDRYLVLLFYVLGLSTGVHLMALLTFFFVALLFYFTRVERAEWSAKQRVFGLMAAGGVSVVAFGLMYPGVVVGLPEVAEQSGAPVAFLVGVVGVLVAGLVWAQRNQRARLHLALLCVTALLIGYSAYALIPIRSVTNPPIDLNNPETTEALIPYLKRDQYGQRELLKGPSFDDRTGRFDPARNVKLFPRRNSFDPGHEALYANYDSDADYFLDYQLGHMYVRYFLWNFAGKAKDEQGSRWISGLVPSETENYVYTTPSERASRNAYFALPLLLGLFGMFYHFQRDARRALAVLLLFLATGLGLVLYLNEIPNTPRERDYIYVASYFAFSLWIGIGGTGVMRWVRDRVVGLKAGVPAVRAYRSVVAGLTAVLMFAAVPGWMAVENYDDHDRAGRSMARDFAYNLLMSLDENAILFTEGDNDTYPLWYVQDVEGIRRDVRVVCLSLLNAPWYPKQLRDQVAYDAPPLPISFTDEELDSLQAGLWQPSEVRLPVDATRLLDNPELRLSVKDTSGFDQSMRWTLTGRPVSADAGALYPVDQVVLDILVGNARNGWERPVYFAATTAPTSRLNLDPYLQREGLALRVVPIRHEQPNGRVVPEIMLDRLSKFRFTNLADPAVYFDTTSRGLAGNHYRAAFSITASKLLEDGRPDEAKRLLDGLLDAVPPDTIPLPFFDAYVITQVYETVGEDARVIDLWRHVEPYVLRDVRVAADATGLRFAIQQAQAIQRSYMQAGAFDQAAALGGRLADALGDEGFRMSPEELRSLYDELQRQQNSGTPTG